MSAAARKNEKLGARQHMLKKLRLLCRCNVNINSHPIDERLIRLFDKILAIQEQNILARQNVLQAPQEHAQAQGERKRNDDGHGQEAEGGCGLDEEGG